MSLNSKSLIFSAVIIILVLFGWRWHYQRARPKIILFPLKEEITITIIPGWNLRQVAQYLVERKIASSTEDVYKYTGRPAYDYRKAVFTLPAGGGYKIVQDKPEHVSHEGYLAPETYRVFKGASLPEVIEKLIKQREKQITERMWADIRKTDRSFYEILTMASVVEKEAPNSDMPKVADIFWRRYDKNWALQSCATVNYITDKNDPAVSDADKKIDSLYNTYKYPGLPLGPISNPSLAAIRAVIYPEKNDYWYFMTGVDGKMHYARTLDEHNANKRKYLR